MVKTDWYLSAGLFNGILFGARTYEYFGTREETEFNGSVYRTQDDGRYYIVDYVLYIGFVQLILTTSKVIDDGE
jgi:hypothetical protein